MHLLEQFVGEGHGEAIKDYQKVVKTQQVILVLEVMMTVPVLAVIVIPDIHRQKKDVVIIVMPLVQPQPGNVTMVCLVV